MLLRTINQEVQDFRTKQVQVVPGLYYNQYETIQNTIFAYNSRFKTGPVDDDGDRKYFLNINKNPCKVCSKAIDFDTKNIRLLTAGGGNPTKTWFMERDLKYWMRDQQFGKVLNRIFHELPIYGTVVLKVIAGVPYFVDLRNFVVEQTAECLKYSNYIIEIHNYTVGEFRRVANQMGWPQATVDKVIDEYHKMKGSSHIRVYERYGEVPKVSADGKTTYSYKRVYHADVGVDEFDQYGNLLVEHQGVELASDDFDPEKLPYWEFHMEKMAGRWLGIGTVETLVEPQIRANELANLQSKTSYWAALRVFQTRDPAGGNRNLMTDTRNGEILSVDSEITQIDMSDRNLAFFNEENQKWFRNRDELTFSYDVVQGERLPAGTPLGSAQIAVGQTMSYFELIQENVALDVKEMLFKAIIPQFEKDNTVEHTLRLVGQDLDAYIGMIKNDMILKEVIRIATTTGQVPSNAERDIIGQSIESSIKQHKEKILTIPKNFYKDVKYDVDIDITGESVDTRVRAATKFAVLQALTADPTMLQDPVKRKIIASYMEDGGINPVDIFGASDGQPMVQSEGRAGGGVSAPQLNAGVQGQVPQTV